MLVVAGATACSPGGEVMARVTWLDGSKEYACRADTMDDCTIAFLDAAAEGEAVIHHLGLVECEVEGPVPIAELSAGAVLLEPKLVSEQGEAMFLGEGPPDGFGTARLFVPCIPGFASHSRATLAGAQVSDLRIDVNLNAGS